MDRSIEVRLELVTRGYQQNARQAAAVTQEFARQTQAAASQGLTPLQKRLAAATQATQQHTTATQAATRAAQEHSAAQKQTAQQSTDWIARLGQMRQAALGVVDGIRLVVGIAQEFIAVGERAAQRERSARMFENLSGGAKAAAENLDAMRKATNYTISEAEAMESAIGLLGMRLANTPQELAQITQQVATLGKQFAGFSAERSIQQFMFAVENQSLQRLGEFGLNITDVTRRVEEFTRAGYDAQAAFKMAVLEGLDEQFQRIGGATVDTKTAFEQYRAAVEDLQAALEAGLLPVATDVVKVMGDLAGWLSGGLQARYSKLGGEILAGTGGDNFAAEVERQFRDTTSLGGALFAKGDVSGQLLALQQNILETATSQDELNAGMEVYTRLLDEWLAKLPPHIRAQKEQEGFIRDVTQATREFNAVQAERVERDAAAERQEMAARAEAERAAMLAREEAIRDVGRQIVAAEREIAERRDAVLEDFARETEDMERQRGREALLAALRAGWALEDADRQTAQRRAAIQEQYEQARAQAAAQFAQAQAQAAQQYARQQQDIERNYQQRLAEIRRQYEKDEFEATLSRDAAALFRARRTRDDQMAQAARDRAEQEQRAGQQYQDALQQAQQAYAQSLAQLEQALREELEARRRAEERARIEQRMQLQWQEDDRQIYLQRRILQVAAAFQAELEMARQHYAALRALEAASRGSVYIPHGAGGSGGANPESFATGGYTSGGLALLHAGEFVLNPQTTRQLEGAVGGRLTQQSVVHRGVTVNANFTGVGASDRGWIEQRLGDFSRELAGMLS